MLKEYTGGAAIVSLAANIDADDLAFATNGSGGWPNGATAPFVVSIVTSGATEKLLCSSRTGSSFVVQQRGYDGTAAAAHTAGDQVKHVIDAISLTEVNSFVNDLPFVQLEFPYRRDPRTLTPVAASLDTTYTVPAGKVLHIQNIHLSSNSYILRADSKPLIQGEINGGSSFTDKDSPSYIYLPAGTAVTCSTPSVTAVIFGFLINVADFYFTPMLSSFSSSTPYTVPANKRLVITHFYGENGSTSSVVGKNVGYGINSNNGNNFAAGTFGPFIVDAGGVIAHSNATSCTLNGYLIDV